MGRQLDPNKTYFFDGKIVIDGKAFFGVPNQDPTEVANQIQIWADRACSVPLSQPQKTSDQGVLPKIYIAEPLYSFYIETSDEEGNEQIIYEPELEPLNTQGLVTSDIDMNGFKHLNVADAAQNNQYLTLGQAFRVFPQAVVVDATSAPDAIVANLPVNPIALLFGQPIRLYLTHGANTGPLTIKLGAFGPKFVYKGNNLPVNAGDTWGNQAFIDVIYDITLDKYQLLNPRNATNANLLEEQNGAYYLARANHTGTIDFNTETTGNVPQSRMQTNSVGSAQIIAGNVGQSEIGGGAVGQGELKTSTQEVSQTGGNANIAVPNVGSYAFYPQFRITTVGVGDAGQFKLTSDAGVAGTAFQTWIFVDPISGTTAVASFRYVTASPPYIDMNGDEVPLWIYAHMNNDGTPRTISVGEEPPWAHSHTYGSNSYKFLKDKNGVARKYVRKVRDKSDPNWLEKFMDNPLPEDEYVLETLQMKNKGMSAIPHPFVDVRGKENGKVILIAPQESEKLLKLHQDGESVCQLIQDGYLKIDNTFLNRATPNGVKSVNLKWKGKKL